MKALCAAVLGFSGATLYQTRQAQVAYASGAAFSQKEFLPYKLVDIHVESHDVKHFRFALPDEKMPLQLPIASCVTLRYVDADGKDVARPYTPVNLSDEKGHFDLVVKCYPNSKMGSHLFAMKKGDTIDVKGPWPTLAVAPSQFDKLGLLAGGTGITPMYQIIDHVLHGKKNTTKATLLFSNKTPQDIIMNKELTALEKEFGDHFHVQHAISKGVVPKGAISGLITKDTIAKTMPPADGKNIKILVSGPPEYMKAVCGPKDFSAYPPKQGELGGYLKELGYKESQVYKF